MFNHMADANAAARVLLAAVLDEPVTEPGTVAPPEWLGPYFDPQTGLVARAEMQGEKIRLTYGHGPEFLVPQADGSATDGATTLRPGSSGLQMDRAGENFSTELIPVTGTPASDIAGRYCCAELDAELTITDSGGVLYGAFSGFLGQGRMEVLTPIGAKLWALPCPRALDHTPPGDWTLHISPGAITVGCWLARGLRYEKLN